MTKTLSFKRGDTFQIDGTRTNKEGSSVSLSGVTVVSVMKRKDTEISLTTEVISEADGTFRLTLPATTTNTLELGNWLSDVEYQAQDGSVVSTETYVIKVLEDVTNASG